MVGPVLSIVRTLGSIPIRRRRRRGKGRERRRKRRS
jgi:hypothetical protein